MDYRKCNNGDDAEYLCNGKPVENIVNGTYGSHLGLSSDQSHQAAYKEKTLDDDENDTDPTFDDLDRGWSWVVMLACFASFFIQGGAMYAVGILHSALLDKYEGSVSMTSWAGGLYVSLCSLAGK